MLARIGGWVAYFAVVAGLIYIGWNQPLRYRFLSQAEIIQIEHPAAASRPPNRTPQPQVGDWIAKPKRDTKLDREAPDYYRTDEPRPAVAPVQR